MKFQFVIGDDVKEQHDGLFENDWIKLEDKIHKFENKYNAKQRGYIQITRNLVLLFFKQN